MSDLKPDVCANCGRIYAEHGEGTKCTPKGRAKWFPKKLADAMTKEKRLRDKRRRDAKTWGYMREEKG